MNYLIATDLDGTLLDHHSYAFDPALPALSLCTEKNIPVIFNTSKTSAESCRLRRRLENHHPFIVENGSAAYIPVGYFEHMPEGCTETDGLWVHRFGKALPDILNALAELNTEHPFNYTGFSDWDAQQVAEHTGLSLQAAGEAKQREYSEPLLWQGDDEQLLLFRSEVEKRGMKLLRGGRFLHVLGDTDKGQAIRWLKRLYEQASSQPLTLVALGDSDNDIDMLQAADIAVIVRSPVREAPLLSSNNRIVHTRGYGPQGWNEAIIQLLDSGKA